MKQFCKDGGLHHWEPVEGSTTPGVHHCPGCGTVATLDTIEADKEPRPNVTIVEIDLPLPPKELHPNARVSWQAAHRKRKPYRHDCGIIAYGYRSDRPGWLTAKVTLRYLFVRKAHHENQRHDPDNLVAWAKAAIDSLADAGILADDRALTYEPAEQYYEQDHDALILLLEVQT